MTSAPWLELSRTVRFSDTDAAGVMHFQQLLGWCHQAWEESLERFGLPAGSVFPGGRGEQPSVALPIVHCHADFRAPVQVGDKLLIRLEPERLDPSSFAVNSQVLLEEQLVAQGCLRHVAIDAKPGAAVPCPMAWTVGWKHQASAASNRFNHSRQRWRCHFPSAEGARSGHNSQRRGVSAGGQGRVRASSRCSTAASELPTKATSRCPHSGSSTARSSTALTGSDAACSAAIKRCSSCSGNTVSPPE